MQFVSLASSSKGNASLLIDQNQAWLIDCGLSFSRLQKALSQQNLIWQNMVGLIITHEHSDHIAGLAMVLKKTVVPCYASHGTIRALALKLGNGVMGRVHALENADVLVAGWCLNPISISHDAQEPLGLSLAKDDKKIGVLTDTGVVRDTVLRSLADCQLLYIESNHDPAMLAKGAYPSYLKKRILSNLGHLSNEACAEAVQELYHDDLKHVILAHLSEQNNRPQLAKEAVKKVLENVNAITTGLYVARPWQENPLQITV